MKIWPGWVLLAMLPSTLSLAAPDWVVCHREKTISQVPVKLTVWAQDATHCARAMEAGVREYERIAHLFFVSRQGSAVSRLNQFAAERPVTVDDETMQVLQWALNVANRSQGVFDPTIASFKWEYGFGQGDYRVPNPLTLDQIKPLVDYHWIMLYPREHTVLFKHQGVQIDLDEIAQSHALNRIRRLCHEGKVRAAEIRVGNNLVVEGIPPGERGWSQSVYYPDDPQRLLTVIPFTAGKLLVARDRDNSFEKDGRRYHDRLDAQTGLPVHYSQLAVLLLPPKPKLDLPVSALMLLPPSQAVQLTEKQARAECLIVDYEQKVWLSRGWAKSLSVERP